MKEFKLTFLLTLLMSMLGAKAFAYNAKIDGIYYNFFGNKAVVTYLSNSAATNSNSDAYSGIIVIPDTVTYNGVTYYVGGIDSQAFRNCRGLRNIVVPNTVTSIGSEAFKNCGLKSITIPNTVTSIAYSTFEDCSSLTSVTIPNSVTSIGNSAFRDCSGLTSVTIPNSLTSIGGLAFAYCYRLTSVTIPNSVTSIGSSAFSECSSLTNVRVPVTDYSAFCNNSIVSLIKSNIEKPIILIDENDNEIKDYSIPEDVTSIGSYAFCNCSGLTSVTIPNSVTSIGHSAFSDCI